MLGTGLDSLKTVFKKVAHKTGEFLGNKIEGKKIRAMAKLGKQNLLKK